MAWAVTTRSKLAIVLGIPLHKGAFVAVDQSMQSITDLGSPYNQQLIDEIELLITKWESFQSVIEGVDLANSGLTKLDVIEFSDRPGARLEDAYKLRDDIAKRISIALRLSSANVSNTGARGRVRS